MLYLKGYVLYSRCCIPFDVLYSTLLYSKGVIWQICYMNMCDITPLIYSTERCDIAVPLNMLCPMLYSML